MKYSQKTPLFMERNARAVATVSPRSIAGMRPLCNERKRSFAVPIDDADIAAAGHDAGPRERQESENCRFHRNAPARRFIGGIR